MNKESKKLTWAVGLVAGLGVLSIAYAALSSTLNINGSQESVNVGYVHFKDSSAAHGIGSTNEEYIGTGGAISGGIFSRDDSSTGLILSTNFGKNWAQALAKPGTLDLNTVTKKLQDTVTITGAELNDYGSFIIYKLDIINESANDMRLKTLPAIVLKDLETGSGKATDGNIERVIYTDCADENFVKPCTTPLTAAAKDDGAYDATKKTAFNYLAKNGGHTTWYLRIGFKNYDKDNNNIHGSTAFGFSVAPNWEAVMG